jgi:uncharacterized protein
MEPQVLDRVRSESGDPHNPTAAELRAILLFTRTIAVVGLSRDLAKAARRVPSYLATKGYDLIPVNPRAVRLLGRPARPSLAAVTEPVDMVLVFRPGAEAGAVVDQVAQRADRPVVWLQEGIRADEAASRARKAGITVVQDLCIFKAHRALELPVGPIPQGPPAEREPPSATR